VLFQRVSFDDGNFFPELSADSYALRNRADWWMRFVGLEHLAIRYLATVRFLRPSCTTNCNEWAKHDSCWKFTPAADRRERSTVSKDYQNPVIHAMKMLLTL